MQRGRNDILRSRTEVLPFGSAIWNLSTAPVPLWGPIGIGRPKPFPSPRPSSSSPRLTNRSLGRKRRPPTGILLSLSTRALRQHWRKRGRLYWRRRGGPGACGPPLQQVLVGLPPPFPERGPGCVSPAAGQWRQKTNSGGLRAVRVFLCWELLILL